MPRYFFDVQNGHGCNRDPHGIDLPGVSHIWEIAVPMVHEIGMAADHRQSPDIVAVVVRDQMGVVVYRSDHVGRCEVAGPQQPVVPRSSTAIAHDGERSISEGSDG